MLSFVLSDVRYGLGAYLNGLTPDGTWLGRGEDRLGALVRRFGRFGVTGAARRYGRRAAGKMRIARGRCCNGNRDMPAHPACAAVLARRGGKSGRKACGRDDWSLAWQRYRSASSVRLAPHLARAGTRLSRCT